MSFVNGADTFNWGHRMGATGMDEPLFVHSIVVKSTEQVSRAIDEECVILNLKNSVYYSLDPVGTHVWNLLRGPRSVDELRDSLLETYDVEAERCERNQSICVTKCSPRGPGTVSTWRAGSA